MQKFKGAIVRFARDEEAATAAEYGMIAAILAAAIILFMGVFRNKLQDMFTSVGTNMDKAR